MKKVLLVKILLLLVTMLSILVFTRSVLEAEEIIVEGQEEVTVIVRGIRGEKGGKGDKGDPGPGSASVRGVYNVMDYGAVGDAVTDDTQAILRAVNAAAPRSIVFFPMGTFVVSDTIPNTKQLTFKGISPLCSRVYQKADKTLFDAVSPSGSFLTCRYEKLHLGSNAKYNPEADKDKEKPALIRMTLIAHPVCEDIVVTGGWYSIHLRGTLFADLIRITSAFNLGRLDTDKATVPTSYPETHIFAERWGGRAINDLDIVSCKLGGRARKGIHVSDTNGEGGVTIRDSLVEAFAVGSIIMEGIRLGSVIERVHLEGLESNIELTGCSGVSIQNSFCGGKRGIILIGCENTCIQGNYLWDLNISKNSYNTVIRNNKFYNCSSLAGELKQSDNFCTRDRHIGLWGTYKSPTGESLVKGDMEVWEGSNPNGFTGWNASRESEIKHSGQYSAKLTGSAMFGLRYDMKPGDFRGGRMTVRFWVYKPQEDGCDIRLLVYYNNWAGSTAGASLVFPAGEWVCLTHTINLPDFNNAFLLIGNANRTGMAYVDDVEVSKEEF